MIAFALSLGLAAAAIQPPKCETTTDIVVLWHKDTPADARAVVTAVLGSACFRVAEEFDGMRREATEMAALTSAPLLAVKAVREVKDGAAAVTMVGLDVIDTAEEELKVLATAEERVADGRPWRDERGLIAKVLDRVISALRPTDPRR